MGLKNAALPLKERALAEAIGQEFRDALREHREELEHARLVQDAVQAGYGSAYSGR